MFSVLNRRLSIATLAAWLLLSLLVLAGMGQLRLVNDYKVFFSEDNPELNAFEYLEQKYSSNDSVLVVVTPEQGDVFQPEVLTALLQLTAQGWQTPFSYRVDSLTNYQYTRAQQDDLLVEDFIVPSLLVDQAELKRRRDYALQQPELVNRLLAADGRVTALNVLVRLPADTQTEAVREVAAYWQEQIERMQADFPQLRFYLTGQVMQNDAFGEATARDLGSLLPLALLLIVLGAGFYLRSWQATLVMTIVMLSSILLALGSAGWLGLSITSVSASAPLIILTMAVADCMHLLQGYRKSRRFGAEHSAAVTESLQANRWPIVLTSLTTAIGFLSMNLSDSPPFRDLGTITALGVLWAMGLSLSLAPALLRLLPAGKVPKTQQTRLTAGLDYLARRAIGRPVLVAASLILGGVLLGANLHRNSIDDTLFEYFDHSYAVRQANDFTYERLTGVASIQYAVRPEQGQLVSSPQFLQQLAQAVAEARQLEGVYHIQSLTDIMKRLNASLHQDDPAYYRLPTGQEASAQTLLLYEMSLPYGLDLSNQVALDKQELRLIVTARKMSSNQLLQLDAAVRQILERQFSAEQLSPGVSADIMFAHIGYRNNVSMLLASVMALIIICALIGLLLRSVRLTLVSIVPTMLPIAMAFGIWGLWVGEVGLSLSVVACMTLGIVVDDTIHLLYRFHKLRQQGQTTDTAIRQAVTTTGPALIGTTVILSVGFLVLASSSFKLNADMGLMTALTLVLALLLDLLLIPALLKLTSRRQPEPIAAALHPD